MSSRVSATLRSLLQHPARIERVAQPVADEVDRQHGEEDRARPGTAPSAARCRDSPWRRSSMRPQVGMSGGKPRPEERQGRFGDDGGRDVDRAGHDHRPQRVGQDVAHHLARPCEAPSARAASTNSFSRSDRNWARTRRATGIQRKPPITTTISTKTPPSTPEHLLQRCRGTGTSPAAAAAACGSDRKRSVSHIRAASTQPRDMPATAPTSTPTTIATSMAAKPDGERDAPAVQHARQQVLAEIVGAQRMRQRRALQLGGEVDVVDRHRPDVGPEQRRPTPG